MNHAQAHDHLAEAYYAAASLLYEEAAKIAIEWPALAEQLENAGAHNMRLSEKHDDKAQELAQPQPPKDA